MIPLGPFIGRVLMFVLMKQKLVRFEYDCGFKADFGPIYGERRLAVHVYLEAFT